MMRGSHFPSPVPRVTKVERSANPHQFAGVVGLPSPLPEGERSDRACAIRVRGSRTLIDGPEPPHPPLRGDLSPPGRGEEREVRSPDGAEPAQPAQRNPGSPKPLARLFPDCAAPPSRQGSSAAPLHPGYAPLPSPLPGGERSDRDFYAASASHSPSTGSRLWRARWQATTGVNALSVRDAAADICAIRVRGNRTLIDGPEPPHPPLRGDLSPPGRGEERLLQAYCKCSCSARCLHHFMLLAG